VDVAVVGPHADRTVRQGGGELQLLIARQQQPRPLGEHVCHSTAQRTAATAPAVDTGSAETGRDGTTTAGNGINGCVDAGIAGTCSTGEGRNTDTGVAMPSD
jgi:hypothetical protein